MLQPVGVGPEAGQLEDVHAVHGPQRERQQVDALLLLEDHHVVGAEAAGDVGHEAHRALPVHVAEEGRGPHEVARAEAERHPGRRESPPASGRGQTAQEVRGEAEEARKDDGHEPTQGEEIVVVDAQLVEVERREGEGREHREEVLPPPFADHRHEPQHAERHAERGHEPAEAHEALRIVRGEVREAERAEDPPAEGDRARGVVPVRAGPGRESRPEEVGVEGEQHHGERESRPQRVFVRLSAAHEGRSEAVEGEADAHHRHEGEQPDLHRLPPVRPGRRPPRPSPFHRP